MLFSLPRTFSATAGRLPSSLLTFLAMSVSFAVLFGIVQFIFPSPHLLQNQAPSSPLSSTFLEASETSDNIRRHWQPPLKTEVNDLDSALKGNGPMARRVVPKTGAGGSEQPEGWPYGEYNYCNMPHVRREEYVRKDEDEWELLFVEVIHRHHKRTPYNVFPIEGYSWDCDDAQLYQYGRPHPAGNTSASPFWHVIDNEPGSDKVNPFTAPGFPGTCQFPQITRGGLNDSWQHGKDLYGVYHDLLHLIPDTPSTADLADHSSAFHDQVRFRVTNNPITSQVAGMVLNGMLGITTAYPLSVQPESIDSLEPSYPCPRASSIYQSYGPGSSYLTSFPTPSTSSRSRWLNHFTSSRDLFARLDAISGVDPNSRDWHQSWDHYFDNLSSRLCHSKPLPCNATTSACISQADAEEVFRLGMWEYSHIYRDCPESLEASAASFGVWLAELSRHLRDVSLGRSELRYMHNVAHDGSVAKLLSVLQVETMVWPGLGSEVVFELFRKKNNARSDEHARRDNHDDTTATPEISSDTRHYIRILWGGRVLRSSSPTLGVVDMLPLEILLDYIDDLVGVGASKVKEMCGL